MHAKRSWRKLHIGVDGGPFIQAALVTSQVVPDDQVVRELLKQIDNPIDWLSADAAYDGQEVYDKIQTHSPNADITIPPGEDAVIRNQ